MSSQNSNIDYTHRGIPQSFKRTASALLLIGLVVVVISYLTDPLRSAFNNIVLLMLLTSVGVGSLFIIGIEYLAGAVWSTPFRRIFEFLASVVLILPIIAIPVYLNVHSVYHWSHEDVVVADKVLSGKEPYLNETFFVIRLLAYFVVWILFYFLFTSNSKKQDSTKDQKLTKRNIRLSAVFMPIFALTLTFSAIDFLMSLEPHWFSTIFGVYYFSGTVLATLAVGAFIAIVFVQKGYFIKGIIKDHYYSFGALLFAFINFWAYIAFSQYMLIWYANLPEETFWFLSKWEGSWIYFSIFLIITHFLVPYFGLLSQPSKMDVKRLKFMSVWILLAHVIDLYWIVLPTYSPDGLIFGWNEIGFILFGIGIIFTMFNWKAKKENIIPIGDPKLKRGLDFRL